MIDKLLSDLKVSRKEDQRKLVIKFLLGFIGPPRKNDYLGNKFKREMRRRVGEL